MVNVFINPDTDRVEGFSDPGAINILDTQWADCVVISYPQKEIPSGFSAYQYILGRIEGIPGKEFVQGFSAESEISRIKERLDTLEKG